MILNGSPYVLFNRKTQKLICIQEDARSKITSVPVRQSALEKAKAEARAKKLRDEKEAASALEDFVKEFDVDVSDDREWRTGGIEGGIAHTSSTGAGGRISMGGGAARRHFTTAPRQVLLSATNTWVNLARRMKNLQG